jgi:Vitamin K-dependent gamma-carboxylase
MLAPIGRRWALDARRKPARTTQVTLWPLRLLQIQLSIIYIAAVWAKLRSPGPWNDGTAVGYALQMGDLQRFALPEQLSTSVLVAGALTYGTLALELALGVLVWNQRLRPWVLLAGVSLHVGIDLTIRVGWFSWVMILLYLAFVPAPVIQAAVARMRRLAGALRGRLLSERRTPARRRVEEPHQTG